MDRPELGALRGEVKRGRPSTKGNVVQDRRRHLHQAYNCSGHVFTELPRAPCILGWTLATIRDGVLLTRAGFCQSRYPWMRKLALEAQPPKTGKERRQGMQGVADQGTWESYS